jgi:hypothetical protein
MIFGGLVVPASVLEKVTLPGSRVTEAALPVPVRFDVCRLASVLTCSCPFSGPAIVGVKVTSIVQLLAGFRLVPQVVDDTAKSPIVEIAMLLTAFRSLLIKVKVLGALAVLTNCSGNVTAAGVRATPLPGIPVPFNPAVCGLSPAVSLTVNCPARVPVAVGAKVTLMVHLLFVARVVPQVVADTAKSPVVAITI